MPTTLSTTVRHIYGKVPKDMETTKNYVPGLQLDLDFDAIRITPAGPEAALLQGYPFQVSVI
ncbi:MAG: hypothetical protein GEU26_17935 [Nitrososphaeraceae archaeon]|nr:hypothetical protein [Nitrososphaeraceae archaeon]